MKVLKSLLQRKNSDFPFFKNFEYSKQKLLSLKSIKAKDSQTALSTAWIEARQLFLDIFSRHYCKWVQSTWSQSNKMSLLTFSYSHKLKSKIRFEENSTAPYVWLLRTELVIFYWKKKIIFEMKIRVRICTMSSDDNKRWGKFVTFSYWNSKSPLEFLSCFWREFVSFFFSLEIISIIHTLKCSYL